MLVYSAPQSVERIPLIDLGGSTAGGEGSADRAIAQRIFEACRDIGFFYVVNHGIPQALLREQLSSAARFFAISLDRR